MAACTEASFWNFYFAICYSSATMEVKEKVSSDLKLSWFLQFFDVYQAWAILIILANDFAIWIFSWFNQMTDAWPSNDWEWTRKYYSWLLMTDATSFHLPFMNDKQHDFLKQFCPTNLGCCAVPSHSFSLKCQSRTCLMCTF